MHVLHNILSDNWFIDYCSCFYDPTTYSTLVASRFVGVVFPFDEQTKGGLRRMMTEWRVLELKQILLLLQQQVTTHYVIFSLCSDMCFTEEMSLFHMDDIVEFCVDPTLRRQVRLKQVRLPHELSQSFPRNSPSSAPSCCNQCHHHHHLPVPTKGGMSRMTTTLNYSSVR